VALGSAPVGFAIWCRTAIWRGKHNKRQNWERLLDRRKNSDVMGGGLGASRRNVLAGTGAAACSLLLSTRSWARDVLRAGVLQFGTVHWLLDVIKTHNLDSREGFTLEVRMVASISAADVALLGQQVDLIVNDWFWVLRQRSLGGDYLFMPYSAATGGVVVPANSPIKTAADLKGKRIGVAGGPLDKSWLLLRAYALTQGVDDLSRSAQPVFAAPPLLNEQMTRGRLDALLNYWAYAARLESAGYRRILTVADMMHALDVQRPIPLVGFVFPAALATRDSRRLLLGFALAVQNAQRILLISDAEWDRIRPLMKVESDAEFRIFRDRYREGLVYGRDAQDRETAGHLFTVLAKIGGEELTGKGVQFDPKVFWDGLLF
jgi:NitT/TauT family transport system substrate-binding protein